MQVSSVNLPHHLRKFFKPKKECNCYVCHMVEVFREVRRVLRDDGCVYLNLGDSYNSGASGSLDGSTLAGGQNNQAASNRNGRKMVGTLKPKDLCMIPARVALALQADGWWVRSEIIWAKKAPMPESVTDRPTRSHEVVWLLSKRARYFWDAEAVKEASEESSGWAKQRKNGTNTWQYNDTPERIAQTGQTVESSTMGTQGTRNARDVWTLGPDPYPEAHFATFPREIPRRAILAGTSARGVCPACGAPWVREVERNNPRLTAEYQEMPHTPKMAEPLIGRNDYGGSTGLAKPGWREVGDASTVTTGWSPSCACPPADPVPAVVLDPFLGSGTTAAVAVELGRHAIGIELNAEYIELARRRLDKTQAPLLSTLLEVP